MPSATPVRYPSGVSTDQPLGPLANYGAPHPFLYHSWADDFDAAVATLDYTLTKTNAGTIAQSASDGGNLLFTTAALAGDLCSLQLPAASFALPVGKKAFYLTQLTLADVLNPTVIAGLIQTTTTPGTVVDGLYFSKVSGASVFTLNSMVGSVLTSIPIPAATFTPVNGASFDLAFTIDRNGLVQGFLGQLVGFVPQSGTGSVTPGRASVSFSPTLTAAVLNPTISVISGTATAKTMIADFLMAATER